MKEMPTHKLKEGMVIGEDVMTKGGQRILTKGKVLTLQSIMRLSFYNIKSVQILPFDSTAEDGGTLSRCAESVFTGDQSFSEVPLLPGRSHEGSTYHTGKF